MFTNKELSDYYDGLSEPGRDGMTKAQFMAEVRKILDPKRNSIILREMVDTRRRERIERHNRKVAEKAMERSRLGLR